MNDELLNKFIDRVKKDARDPSFFHHQWYVKYHLEIVEKISLELCNKYPEADKNFVILLCWLHDYGKIINFEDQYKTTLTEGMNVLRDLGFSDEVVSRAKHAIEVIDGKDFSTIQNSSIEIQIVSSADGASHLVGPFINTIFYEYPERSLQDLMDGNINKMNVDWNKKIVLPEVRKAFENRRNVTLEQNGQLPDSYI